MDRTFTSENDRKTKLFESWIEYLGKTYDQSQMDSFDEIYEGLANVSEVSKNRIGLHLDDGRKLRGIVVSPEISAGTLTLDALYLALGRKDGRWLPLEIISIGSFVDCDLKSGTGQIHITFNPLLVGAPGAEVESL